MGEHITARSQSLGALSGRDHGTTAFLKNVPETFSAVKYHASAEALEKRCSRLCTALVQFSRAEKTL